MKSPADDPAEADLAWKGYSTSAMLPSFFVCVLLSAVLLTGGWFFEEIRGLGEREGSFLFFGTTVAIWVVQIVRWFYRGATYTFRLTPKHVFLDWGFLYNPVPPVELARVAKVTWGYIPWGRPFRVGWVRLRQDDGREVCLSGIKRPAAFADMIRKQVAHARAPG